MAHMSFTSMYHLYHATVEYFKLSLDLVVPCCTSNIIAVFPWWPAEEAPDPPVYKRIRPTSTISMSSGVIRLIESTELLLQNEVCLQIVAFHQATQAPNSQLRSNSFATTGTVIGVAAAAVAAASNGAVRSRKAAVAFWQHGKSMPEPQAT